MFGSLERLIGILIEHTRQLPTWLGSGTAVVMGITERQEKYCLEIAEKPEKSGASGRKRT